MVPASFTVILDANVLFPFTLRDTLLRAAAAGLYEVRWSAYESLIPTMKNQEKDRHVVAAAVKAGAQVIVTANMKDFSKLPEGIEAQPPDAFLCNLFHLDPSGVIEILHEQAEDLVNPPMTFEEVLQRLARVAPEFVAVVRDHIGA
jgi:hypothetical protein